MKSGVNIYNFLKGNPIKSIWDIPSLPAVAYKKISMNVPVWTDRFTLSFLSLACKTENLLDMWDLKIALS